MDGDPTEKKGPSKPSSKAGSRRGSRASNAGSKKGSSKKRKTSPKSKSPKTPASEPREAAGGESSPDEEAAPTVDVPLVTEATRPKTPPKPAVLKMLKERVLLTGFKPSMWKEEHEYPMMKFIEDPSLRLMVAFIDQYKGFVLEFSLPPYPVSQLTYFIKCTFVRKLTLENFHKSIQYGSLNGPHIESLLRAMDGFFAPAFFENHSWPDSIQNEFASHLHRFLGKLTDTRWKLLDKTVLYVPKEGLQVPSDVSSKKTEYVQRLETAMIHWIRQIKDILASELTLDMGDNPGPLQEIEFWNKRCTNLTSISKQLDKEGIVKVTDVLTCAKSSYIGPFNMVSDQIKEESKQAESNLKFLLMLKDPCFELSQGTPESIPKILPKIINYIRIIWVNAPYYKSRERLTALFKKVSNEIINRCKVSIDLDKIFEGYVQSGLTILQQCIELCEGWKELYNKTSKMHHQMSPVPWVLDKSSIFAQIDAFVQRCKDLIEVCKAQKHFGRMEDGNKSEMPQFAGQKGPEVAKGLLEIEKTFDRMLKSLGQVKHKILDVKVTTWHDDFNNFRDNMKTLEVMMQNMITAAFETVTTIEGGVELLDIFCHLQEREAIRRMIDKKTKDVWMMFNTELNSVKQELSQKPRLQMSDHPQFAGMGLWARHLKNRINRNMVILTRAHFLPYTGTGEEVRAAFLQLNQALDDYIRKTAQEWMLSLEKEPMKLLDVPLMCRSNLRPPMLDINFDRRLEKIFQEVYYWERIGFDIPHYIRIATNRREDLRSLKEHVLLVVRDYNRIIAALSFEERSLFRERIRYLDKKIHPGLSKLTWVSHGISEYFVTDCRANATKIQLTVDDYKGANTEIAAKCVKISELLLLKIEPRRVYEKMDFDSSMNLHRENVSKRLSDIHNDIVRIMRRTFDIFKKDGSEVQVHWHKYTEKMDHMVEEAFRLNVKWSLLELFNAIKGDGKAAPNPLFNIKVQLEGHKVEFDPSLSQLAHVVSSEFGHITKAISHIQRLPVLLTPKECYSEPIHEVIARNEETRKMHSQINKEMQTNAALMQNYLKTWETYREIWEIDKDMFIQRYKNLDPPVSAFDADIARYDEVANNIEAHETIGIIQFMMLDCSPLKYAILSHCQQWQTKFTKLLKLMATNKLQSLNTYLVENSDKISQPPQTLSELGVSLNLWDKLHSELDDTESQFAPLNEEFQILEKYQVSVEEVHLQKLGKLTDEWTIFQESLKDAEGMLKKHKDIFKTGLLAQSDEFKRQVHILLDNFQKNGPFTSTIGPGEALESIHQYEEQLIAFKQTQQQIRSGLNIFKIDQPPNKEIMFLEKELQYIEDIWHINKEWEGLWKDWKTEKFSELKTEDMEATSIGLHKKLLKYSKMLADMFLWSKVPIPRLKEIFWPTKGIRREGKDMVVFIPSDFAEIRVDIESCQTFPGNNYETLKSHSIDLIKKKKMYNTLNSFKEDCDLLMKQYTESTEAEEKDKVKKIPKDSKSSVIDTTLKDTGSSVTDMIPQDTESSVTDMIPKDTESLVTAMIPKDTGSSVTDMIPKDTESLVTAMIPKDTGSSVTDMIPKDTESSVTDMIPKDTESLVTAMIPKDTESLVTDMITLDTGRSVTDMIPKDTESLVTAMIPKDTESSVTDMITVDTESLVTAMIPKDTESLVTDKITVDTESLVTDKITVDTGSSVTDMIPKDTESLVTDKITVDTGSSVTDMIPKDTESLVTDMIPKDTESLVTDMIPKDTESLVTDMIPKDTESLVTDMITLDTGRSVTDMIPKDTESLVTAMIPKDTESLVTAMIPKDTGPSVTDMVPKDTGPSVTDMVPKDTESLVTDMIPKDTESLVTAMIPKDTGSSVTDMIPKDTGSSVTDMIPKDTESLVTDKITVDTGSSVTDMIPKDTESLVTDMIPKDTGRSVTDMIPKDTESLVTAMIPKDTGHSVIDMIPQDTESLVTAMIPKDTKSLVTDMIPKDTESLVTDMITLDTGHSVTDMIPQDTESSVTDMIPKDTGSSVTDMIPKDTGSSVTDMIPKDTVSSVTDIISKDTESSVKDMTFESLEYENADILEILTEDEDIKHVMKEIDSLEGIGFDIFDEVIADSSDEEEVIPIIDQKSVKAPEETESENMKDESESDNEKDENINLPESQILRDISKPSIYIRKVIKSEEKKTKQKKQGTEFIIHSIPAYTVRRWCYILSLI